MLELKWKSGANGEVALLKCIGAFAGRRETVRVAKSNRLVTMPLEIWLRPNRRILLVATVAPALLVLLGLVVALNVFGSAPPMARVIAAALAVLGGGLLAVLAWFFRQPRLTYDGRHLHVNLRAAKPIAVPIELVECFFLGAGFRRLPGKTGREVQMSQLRIRLAERATEWAQFDVKPALGAWCGGYITIHGAWCEPLDIELVHRLNARLAAAHEAQPSSNAPQLSLG
jgi:hypothetical protein